jgi:hypothetical protein
MEPIEEIEYKGYKIKVYPDEDPDTPRDWDNLCTMTCFHTRYDLGDKHNYGSNSFTDWEELAEYLIKEEKAYIIHPLFMCDHSGITIRMGQGFSDIDSHGWDWGQIGFIWVTRDQILNEFGTLDEKVRQKAEEIMAMEVKIYDQYLRGEVYGYDIEPVIENGGSVWGFYGSDHDKSGLLESAKEEIDYEIEPMYY